MKYKLIIIALSICCVFSIRVFSQVAFELSKMNVLYAGIENPISVGCEINFDSLHIDKAECIKILDTTNGTSVYSEYKIIPLGIEVEMQRKKLELYKGGKVIATREIRIKKLPDPVGQLQGFSPGSTISLSFLKTSRTLLAMKPDGFDLNVNYVIIKWELTVLTKVAPLITQGSGGSLNSFAMTNLEKSEVGSIIFIDIEARAPDGTIRKVWVKYVVG